MSVGQCLAGGVSRAVSVRRCRSGDVGRALSGRRCRSGGFGAGFGGAVGAVLGGRVQIKTPESGRRARGFFGLASVGVDIVLMSAAVPCSDFPRVYQKNTPEFLPSVRWKTIFFSPPTGGSGCPATPPPPRKKRKRAARVLQLRFWKQPFCSTCCEFCSMNVAYKRRNLHRSTHRMRCCGSSRACLHDMNHSAKRPLWCEKR